MEASEALKAMMNAVDAAKNLFTQLDKVTCLQLKLMY